jgi:hypothetical protein
MREVEPTEKNSPDRKADGAPNPRKKAAEKLKHAVRDIGSAATVVIDNLKRPE